jgi:deoxycytidine triphosphate deaminase
VDFEGDVCIISSKLVVLANLLFETFNIPDDVTGIVVGKSTYALWYQLHLYATRSWLVQLN